MATSILTITLNPAVDRFIRHDRPGAPELFFAGGKGINVARTLGVFGSPVRAVFPSGGEAGRRLEHMLLNEKMPYRSCAVYGETRTNLTVVAANGRIRRTMAAGARLSRRDQERLVAFCRREMRGSGVVVFSGSLPPGFSLKAYAALLVHARRSGAMVAADAAGGALKAACAVGVDIIKPNRREAEEFLGSRLSSVRMIRKALRTFNGYGIKKVLVSLGCDGLAASDGRQELLVRTPVVRTGHAVGCGDAALAGFISACLGGKDIEAAVSLAAACGHANVLADVPGGIILKDVARALKKREIIWL